MMHKMCALAMALLVLIGCSDANKDSSRASTASSNVSVLPFEFMLDGLDRQRTIRLYLPPDYANSTQSYPVLYMHDGQNVFDDATSYAGEWGVDESLNQLAANSSLRLIVVAIDNGGDYRMKEMSPWENKRFGEAQGQQYMDFIVDVVKPYIDNNYRTEADVKHTAIMGSSMGGLISHYAIHAYPHVFSKAGIFSPSYWYSTQVFDYSKLHKADLKAKLYVMYGDKEGDGMIADTDRMQRQLTVQGHPQANMLFKRVVGAEHNEKLWRSEFTEAIQWLFAD
ncbi:alpha/beta hydrolase-fold protein [Paraglaciecola sp.]|uniref:alpha/beta hydrolase n=1 Tax=Paraglaciecola sp. TaxID=1920173 RepID=UPI0030F3F7EF